MYAADLVASSIGAVLFARSMVTKLLFSSRVAAGEVAHAMGTALGKRMREAELQSATLGLICAYGALRAGLPWLWGALAVFSFFGLGMSWLSRASGAAAEVQQERDAAPGPTGDELQSHQAHAVKMMRITGCVHGVMLALWCYSWLRLLPSSP